MWFNSNTAQNLTNFCIGIYLNKYFLVIELLKNSTLLKRTNICFYDIVEDVGVSLHNARSNYFQVTVATDKSAWLSSVVL